MLTVKETVIYGGHLSKFGDAFIKQILVHPYFDTKVLVLAGYNRWKFFSCKLQMLDKLPNERKYKKNYQHKTKLLLKYLKTKHPELIIRFTEDANNQLELNKISNNSLILSAAFPQIFSENFIKNVSMGAINFHPSFLPRCRGANPVYWTIATRESFGGVSAHFMTTKIDQGAIIAREKIIFDENTITYDELYDLVVKELLTVIDETVLFFKENKQVQLQNDSEATYFRNEQFIHRKIYWQTENLEQISAKIRAGEAHSYTASGKLIYIRPPVQIIEKSRFVTNGFDGKVENGTIIWVKPNQLCVKGQNGYIIFEYQKERKLEDLPNHFLKWLGWHYLGSKIDFLDRRNLKIGEKLC